MYTPDDVERQFGMSARSRLTRREIHGVLRALRNLDRKKGLDGEVVATAGEILGEDEEHVFEQDATTDDTRVRTAVAWLEEAVLLSREENRVQVFPSSLRVGSLDEARANLARANIADIYRRQLLAISESLIDADTDEGISTDELMTAAEGVRGALYDLERLGIARNDTVLTAFVHTGVERSSRKRFEEASALEEELVDLLRESAPDMGRGDTSTLHLRLATQRLKDDGHTYALPERLERIVRSIPADGRLLDHLLASLPQGGWGTDLLAETTLKNLLAAIKADMILTNEVRDPARLMDRALLWLHEQEVVRLNKGLTVFRPAMTIRLQPERRGFAQADFASLKLHYDQQVRQIHVMAEYVQRCAVGPCCLTGHLLGSGLF